MAPDIYCCLQPKVFIKIQIQIQIVFTQNKDLRASHIVVAMKDKYVGNIHYVVKTSNIKK